MRVIIKKFIVFQFIAVIAVGCYGSKKSIKIIHANDLYKKGSLISNNKFKPYTRYIDTISLRIFSLERVSDTFIKDVALIYESMFDEKKLIDPIIQKHFLKTLQNFYVYQRIGLISPDFNRGFDCCPQRGKYQHNHVDFIWEKDQIELERQANEIVEHLLHTITTVGFYYAFPDEWRWDKKDSPINLAMQEAVDKGHYNISSYSDLLNRDREGYAKVTAQEFAYWVILAEWNYFYLVGGPNDEFNLHTSSQIASKLPLAHKLYLDTVAKVIGPPDNNLLNKWHKFK